MMSEWRSKHVEHYHQIKSIKLHLVGYLYDHYITAQLSLKCLASDKPNLALLAEGPTLCMCGARQGQSTLFVYLVNVTWCTVRRLSSASGAKVGSRQWCRYMLDETRGDSRNCPNVHNFRTKQEWESKSKVFKHYRMQRFASFFGVEHSRDMKDFGKCCSGHLQRESIWWYQGALT